MAGTQEEVITTGVATEEKRFKWKIENYDVVRRTKELIQKQRFDFQCGSTLGLPSEWSCRLWYHIKPSLLGAGSPPPDSEESTRNQEWVGIFFHLEKLPEGVQDVTFTMGYTIFKPNGDIYYTVDVPAKCQKQVGDLAGWGKKCVFPKKASIQNLPISPDGSVEIHCKLQVFATHPHRADLSSQISRFHSQSVQRLSKDLLAALEQVSDFSGTSSIANNDDTSASTLPLQLLSSSVKIISREGRQFLMDRSFLAARSPVFRAMFKSQMRESHTGIVNMDDLSAQTIQVLLHFIYTGMLHELWCHEDVITEFVYAAEKYELTELLEFYDRVLGSLCTIKTAGRLLIVTGRLNLKNAEQQIFSFIQKHMTSAEVLISIAKDIARVDLNSKGIAPASISKNVNPCMCDLFNL